MDSNAQVAAQYVSQGWGVVGLHDVGPAGFCSCGSVEPEHTAKQAGKHPRSGEWQLRPLGSVAAVREYFAANPSANVGILTGPASGIWVLDVDPDNGGDASLSELVALYGTLPETYTVRTGSGGAHFYFLLPEGVDITNAKGELKRYRGLDVRGRGGQVVAPPSVSGKGPYSVLVNAAPAVAPGWLLELIRRAPVAAIESFTGAAAGGSVLESPPVDLRGMAERGPRYAREAVGRLLYELANAPSGQRNDTAFRVACRLAELVNAPWSSLSGDLVAEAFMEAAEVASASDASTFPQSEAAACLRKGIAHVGGRPAELPAPENMGTHEVDWGLPATAVAFLGGATGGLDSSAPVASVGTASDSDFGRPPDGAWAGGAGELAVVTAVTTALTPEELSVAVMLLARYREDQGDPKALAKAERELVTRRLAKANVEARDFERTWHAPARGGSLAWLMANPLPEVAWRVAGLLPASGNAVVIAPRKTGKSTLVGSLIKALIDGAPFLGQHAVDPVRNVAFFNYENPERMQEQWLAELGVGRPESVHTLHLRGQVLALNVPKIRAWVTEWLMARQVDVWIIDPYARAGQGVVLSENDNAQANAFTEIVDQIKRDAGVCEVIMPSHSSGKGEVETGAESARGAGRLEDWADALWYLTRADTGQRFLRADGRDVELPETVLHFDRGTRLLSLGPVGTSKRKHGAEQDAALVAKALREWGEATPATGRQLAAACDLTNSRSRFDRAVKLLLDGNHIWTEDGPRGAKYHHLGGKPNNGQL